MTTPPTPRPTLRDELYSLVMGAVEYRQDPDMAADATLSLLRERLTSCAGVEVYREATYQTTDGRPSREKAYATLARFLDAIIGEQP